MNFFWCVVHTHITPVMNEQTLFKKSILIGCLNLLPIHVSFRKLIPPQKWEFQYRILNCIIFKNEKLNLIGVVESPNCTFCKEEAESVEHVLFSCRISSDFGNMSCPPG